jgi:hypothetical protein
MEYLFCKIKSVQHDEGGSGEWTDRHSTLISLSFLKYRNIRYGTYRYKENF